MITHTLWSSTKLDAIAVKDDLIIIGVKNWKGEFIGHINVSMDFDSVAGNQTGNAYFVDARDPNHGT